MSDEIGFNVSVREVYNEVRSLKDLLNSWFQEHAPEQALIKQRLTLAEAAITELHADAEARKAAQDEDERQRGHLRTQVRGTIAGTVITAAVTITAATLPFVLK